jgi:hypothetical protein
MTPLSWRRVLGCSLMFYAGSVSAERLPRKQTKTRKLLNQLLRSLLQILNHRVNSVSASPSTLITSRTLTRIAVTLPLANLCVRGLSQHENAGSSNTLFSFILLLAFRGTNSNHFHDNHWRLCAARTSAGFSFALASSSASSSRVLSAKTFTGWLPAYALPTHPPPEHATQSNPLRFEHQLQTPSHFTHPSLLQRISAALHGGLALHTPIPQENSGNTHNPNVKPHVKQ